MPDVPWISIGSEAFTSSITWSAYPSNLPSAVCFAAHCCFQIGAWLPGLSEHKQMRGGDADDVMVSYDLSISYDLIMMRSSYLISPESEAAGAPRAVVGEGGHSEAHALLRAAICAAASSAR